MLLIPCPYCGNRPELEFAYAGQAHVVRPPVPAEADDRTWSAYLYERDNVKGLNRERWRHVHGCARFFNAVRDTRTDHFIASYRIGETGPEVDQA